MYDLLFDITTVSNELYCLTQNRTGTGDRLLTLLCDLSKERTAMIGTKLQYHTRS
jgi:hypothetical protein